MSALAAPSGMGASHAATAPRTLRVLLETCRAERKPLTLDEAIAIFVPVCLDLKERHDRGERVFVHAAAIAAGPEGLMRLEPALARAPSDPRDRAAIAPELVKGGGPGEARASVFAVGAMFYEAITGSPVGPGMRRPRDVDPSLPESLEILLGKALVADPQNRPDDLGALASAMHHLAPMKSIPPPEVDITRFDETDGHPVDVRSSLLPPAEAPGARSVTPPLPAIPPAPSALRDPTLQLAQLKARLESDLRPRYVVNKDRMDHGPFNAVELLQQIASHKFRGEDQLRDELTGRSQSIDEWEEFAPFAQHATMHRQIAQEKVEVAQVEKAEKTAGVAKFVVGGVLAASLLAGGIAYVVKQVGERKDASDLSDDPSALDLSNGGGLKGTKKATAGAKGGRAGGGGPGVSGASYDDALNQGSELNMGGAKTPDLTNDQLAAPMKSAGFVGACGAPNDMKVTVKVAVKLGRAVGVSVFTNPQNATVASCIDRHVRGLSWPSSPKLDSFTTTY